MRFSRPESEQARQRRVQSYEFLQKKHAEEPWVHLHYYGLRDSRSEHERQYLLCPGSSGVENTELVKSPRWDGLGQHASWMPTQGPRGSLVWILPKDCGPSSSMRMEPMVPWRRPGGWTWKEMVPFSAGAQGC